ncbi:dihydroxyacetone kinase subunit DhaK [Microtetraspora fusca]|uniref:dihydroxyacetone kinase subunit DhaK n=1 Tax=Microtetraspora fusca TaxID=1997 RepID=UPI00082AD26B|nr:dihydroxyacetone kinase subunit DhaK [Microtetraspora fusca]
MKKLVNDVSGVVPDMLEGLALTHPEIALLDGETVAVRADVADFRRSGRVAIVSGGGSGHEPAHAGYVGRGMLTAAVCGDVFTSPSTDTVLETIRTVAGPAGVLLIVKNYTGDRLNFGLAAELAKAEGIPVEVVVVADDVALDAGEGTAGRRGIAGTVFVHKVAGAAAEAGLPLAEVRREAEAAAAAVGSMGVGLSACTVPAAGRPGFELGPDEVELGLGIHGEPGVRRTAVAPADVVVDTLLDRITADLGLTPGDRVALLVNNLGGTPLMELQIVARRAVRRLAEQGFRPERVWTGSFLTALEMAGCSMSVLRVDDRLLDRLDAPVSAPAWPAAHLGRVRPEPLRVPGTPAPSGVPAAGSRPAAAAAGGPPLRRVLERVVEEVCAALIAAEPELTAMDQAVGDGDLGISLTRGADAVRREFPGYGTEDPAAVLRALSATLRRALGGTSGPLYAVLLLRAAAVLEEAGGDPTPRDWARALAEGARAVSELGGAEVGDRTMLDALVPAADALRQALDGGAEPCGALSAAVEAARKGTAATAAMTPRRGRSSYLGERAVGRVDPGAEAVAIWLEVVSRTLCEGT